MKKIYSLLVFFCFVLANAQNPADLDSGFNNAPIAINQFYNENYILKIDKQADGKLLILNNANTLVRIDENGVDNTFNTAFELNSTLTDFCILPNGKIVVVGNFMSYAGVSRIFIVQINSDGSIDNTFVPVGNSFYVTTSTYPKKVVALADGKVMVHGSFSTYNNVTVNGLARLNPDGTLDTSFAGGGYADYDCRFFVQSDGKFLVLTKSTTDTDFKTLHRCNSDGSFDSSFTANSINTGGIIPAVTLQNDGKIIVAGKFTNYGSSNNRSIVRLDANGNVDPTFVSTGFETSAKVTRVLAQPDGKIIAVGDFDSYYGTTCMGIVKLNPDGSKDDTFDSTNAFFHNGGTSIFNALLWQPGDKIIAAGSISLFNGLPIGDILRINPDGSRDESFTNVGKGFDGQVNASALQPDGKILIAGNFARYNGAPTQKLIRLNADGSRDTTFNLPGLVFNESETIIVGPYNNPITFVTVQPDGKILVGGDFVLFDGESQRGIVRLNSDGSKDTTFNIGTGFTSSAILYGVRRILLQSDGKIIVFGYFDTYNSQPCPNIIRLNPDGSLDTTFTSSLLAPTADILGLHLQPDGKLLVGGDFQSTVDETLVNSMVRLNSDGSRDITFNYTFGYEVSNIYTQSDGKILIKVLTTWNGQARIYRLNASGSMDSSFTYPNPGNTHKVNNFILLPDGKILNNFTYSGWYSKMERLNSNGTIDSSFDSTIGLNERIFNLLLQPDGKVIATGNFTTYKGFTARRILRILNEQYYFVQGNNRYDGNGNGCDSGDLGFPILNFQIASNTNDFNYITNTSGNYNLGLTAGNYTLTPVFENPSYFSVSPANVAVNFPSQASPVTQNFCITPVGNHPDLEILILPLSVARPGFDSRYKIVCKNKGNQFQSGTVSFTYDDSVIDLVTSLPSVTTQTTNTLNWNFTDMPPMTTNEIFLTLNLNSPTETPALNAGSYLDFNATATSSLTDDTPEDNSDDFRHILVNSLDPNDKTCLEGNSITVDKVGDYVHYMIRFENTGTFAAQNVSVVDLIDVSKYDISSLMPISGSHLFVTKITDGNKVEFYFKDINLPFADATNDGYVAFKIKTLSSLQQGDSFSNSASIYFDYNFPIDTETATTFIQNLATGDFATERYVTINPNPTNGLLEISRKENITISSIAIYNTLGQLVMAIPNAQNVSSIDVSNLRSGNYFIQLNSNKGIATSRFIKL